MPSRSKALITGSSMTAAPPPPAAARTVQDELVPLAEVAALMHQARTDPVLAQALAHLLPVDQLDPPPGLACQVHAQVGLVHRRDGVARHRGMAIEPVHDAIGGRGELHQRGQRVVDPAPPQQRPDNLPAHHAQFGEGAVPMHPHTEVHLPAGLRPARLVGVDQQSHLHAVPRREGQRGQQSPGPGVLAAEGLHDACEVGEQERDRRPGDQLGHPPTAQGAVGLSK